MPKTVKTPEEVRAQIIAAGYQGEPTVAILRQFGAVIDDPLEGVEVRAPIKTAEELRTDGALLIQEAKDNSVPAQVLAKLKAFIGIAIKVAK